MQHIIETFVPVPMLDVPVPLMVEQLVDVLQFFDTFLPVVAEQVIDVPKIIFEDIPTRTPLREPQLWNSWRKCQQSLFSSSRPLTFQFLVVVGVSQIFKVSSQNRVQQLVVVDVFKVFFIFVVFLHQRHPHFFALQSMRSTLRMSRLTGFFALFPGLKKCEDRRALECEAGCAHELIHAERSSNGSRRCGYHLG